ncbi:hypothetical protein BU23DRAFT_411433, partial [Bimuria novae-zelandiae CBS 107.79]
MDSIEAASTAIESREPGESFSYRKVAKDYSVVESTLRRRHQGLTASREDGYARQRNLSHEEEIELLHYIKTLTERGLPPTRQMIKSFASTIACREVSIAWVDQFTAKNKESLISRWTAGIDRDRHAADSPYKYELYFNLLRDK